MKAETYQAEAPFPGTSHGYEGEQKASALCEKRVWSGEGGLGRGSHPERFKESKAATKGGGDTAACPASTARGLERRWAREPCSSQGRSGRRSAATLPGEGEIRTGPPRGGIRGWAIASSPPGADGGVAPPLKPREDAGGCPHAAGGAAAPSPGRSRRPPRPVPGGRARDSPAPGAPLRAAGPLTATALPLGELPACHSSPHAYWCSASAASPAPPRRARRAESPSLLHRRGRAARSRRAAIGCSRRLSAADAPVIGCGLPRPAPSAQDPPRGGRSAGGARCCWAVACQGGRSGGSPSVRDNPG